MKDIFEKTRTFTRAREAMEMGLYPFFQPLQDSDATTALFRGKEVVMIGSNNYLGLTTHPKVKRAAMEAIERFGTSCTGSRFLNGTLQFHLELDNRLAKFVGKEAAIVFSTGYQTNVGVISAIVGRGDFAILDKDDHASIVDGCFMARGMNQAEMRRFSHNDPDSLEYTLSKIPADAGKLVIVDGIYSMGGDIAPLAGTGRNLQAARRAHHGRRRAQHRRAGAGAWHGLALRPDRRSRPDHGHLQQVAGVHRGLHRR
ncbi:MAG: hypothetical protein KatS3mg051_0667 [Anaerolineae bacterium]|nr:MAG: hypothetical protein KatS3mg051_0667 [Anaerolineae bacterium]